MGRNIPGRDEFKSLIKVWFLLAVFVFNSYNQEPVKPVQIDEFGRISCEELLARTDNFYVQIRQNPTAKGLVIIRPTTKSPLMANWFRKVIANTLLRDDSGIESVKFMLGPPGDSIGGSFWLIPAGATMPASDASEWPERKHDLTKPFVYDINADEDICPTFVPKYYADILKSNPKVRGHIVVSPTLMKYQREIGSVWVKRFTEKYGVPRKQLRVFYTKPVKSFKVEFWIVPARKR